MAYRDTSGISACHQLITVLETQLQMATQLRDQLETGAIVPTSVPAACERLLQNAVETARAAALVRDQLCRPPAMRGAMKPYTRSQ